MKPYKNPCNAKRLKSKSSLKSIKGQGNTLSKFPNAVKTLLDPKRNLNYNFIMEDKKENKQYHKEWYKKNRKRLLSYQKEYRKKNKKIIKEWKKNHPYYWRDWKRNHPEYRHKQAEDYRKWYIKNGRRRSEISLKAAIEWGRKNPEKVKSSKLLREYIKRGIVKKPNKCSICKEKRKIIGHHPNYSKPLKAIWVCYSCHKKIHFKNSA